MSSPVTVDDVDFYAYEYAHHPVQGVARYTDFQFSPNFVAFTVLLMLAYSIPCYSALVRLFLFIGSSKSESAKLGVIFNAFVQMQTMITCHGVADFLAVRIPSTCVLTRYLAGSNPQLLMRSISFSYYLTSYSSQFLTMLFCLTRVVILYCPAHTQTTFEARFKYLSLLAIAFSSALAVPQFVSEGVSLQLFRPFPFGSVVILSRQHYLDPTTFNAIYCSITSTNMVVILVTTVLMFRKLRERRSLNVSNYNSKAEKTLTVTIILILVPFVFIQMISVTELLRSEQLFNILFFRPFVIDFRIHLVTWYFVLTHPAFGKAKVTNNNSAVNSSVKVCVK